MAQGDKTPGKFFDVAFQNGERVTLIRRLLFVETHDADFMTFVLMDGRKIIIGRRFIHRMEEVA